MISNFPYSSVLVHFVDRNLHFMTIFQHLDSSKKVEISNMPRIHFVLLIIDRILKRICRLSKLILCPADWQETV